ncbi:hypothetical protein Pelo_5804 [Pelomyxa schiedti]|nr:hypothetical protein Pelo_5804 [Pelomyxa schiedti]
MKHHEDDNADYCLSARDQFVALATMELHNANEESWKDHQNQPERVFDVSGYQGHFNDQMCHNGFVVLVGESHVDLVDALTGTWIMRQRLHLHSSFRLHG